MRQRPARSWRKPWITDSEPKNSIPLTLPRLVGDILFYFGLVALIEELIFRGLVYRALDEWRGARWAIWGSTVGFVLFHVGWRSPLQDELDGTQVQTTVPSVPADAIVGSAAWAEMEPFQAGYLAYLQGDDIGAAERLAEAVSLNPHSARYGYYLGVSLANLGREEEAIVAFEVALAGDPGSSYCAYIYYRLGLIYEAMGTEDEMRAVFEQVLVLDIGDEEIEGYARRALGQ